MCGARDTVGMEGQIRKVLLNVLRTIHSRDRYTKYTKYLRISSLNFYEVKTYSILSRQHRYHSLRHRHTFCLLERTFGQLRNGNDVQDNICSTTHQKSLDNRQHLQH